MIDLTRPSQAQSSKQSGPVLFFMIGEFPPPQSFGKRFVWLLRKFCMLSWTLAGLGTPQAAYAGLTVRLADIYC